MKRFKQDWQRPLLQTAHIKVEWTAFPDGVVTILACTECNPDYVVLRKKFVSTDKVSKKSSGMIR